MMENKQISFEVVKHRENEEISIPKRETAHSAGYDFQAADSVVVPSLIKTLFNALALKIVGQKEETQERAIPIVTMVPTGIKAKMPDDVGLFLYNRSSNPGKVGLILANAVGVTDKDYYGNEGNDGEIMFAFYNIGFTDIIIQKGTRVGQGVFKKFLTTDEDQATGTRKGGFGSTNE